jgi:uncharacterized protein
MHINVAQLLMAPVGSIQDVEVNNSFLPEPEAEFESLSGSLQLMHTNNGIWAKAQINSLYRNTCSRCLHEFVRKTHFSIDEIFFSAVDVHTGMRLHPSDGADSFTIDEAHTLDISEAIRQYTIMSLPMKPLCKKDCAGLCPVCGTDRTHQTCDCGTSYRNPQWSGLIDLPGSK